MSLDKKLRVPVNGQVGNGLVDVSLGDIVAEAVAEVSGPQQAKLSGVEVDVGANGLAMSGAVRAGSHTVTGGEAGAHTVALPTGITTLAAMMVMVLRAGAVATSNAAVSFATGSITVADGATYVLTTGDVIHWIAVGA